MSTLPNPAQERTYPLPAPADDRRFTLGLVFDVVKILAEHGYPKITCGGDLVALQQALYGFIYRPLDDGGLAERLLEEQQRTSRAARLVEERATSWGYAPRGEPHPAEDGGVATTDTPAVTGVTVAAEDGAR